MRAVNLIPPEARRGGGGLASLAPTYGFLGLLAVALVFVTIYVLTSNSISDRQAKLASLQAQTVQAEAQSASLSKYGQFAQLAQSRATTVRQIAATRFDWHRALSDLSKVVPANTSLQSLSATVAPGATVGSAGGSTSSPTSGAASGLRGDIPAPAFEMTGCTANHEDVARLMSRLRLIEGVTRVTLGSSQQTSSTQGSPAPSSPAGSSATAGCGPNAPTFDLVVFFSPVPGAGPSGATSLPGTGTPAGAATAASGAATTAGGAK